MAINWKERGVPTVPDTSVDVRITTTGLITNFNVLLSLPDAFVALIVTVPSKILVGVPEISPVPVFKLNPFGNVPVTEYEVASLLATIWYVKGCSALPVVVRAEVIAGGMPAKENVSVLTPPNPFELRA